MKKLIFVTGQYPYGNGETFIENEIQYLSRCFDKIYIYAVRANLQMNLTVRKVPNNVCYMMSDYNTVSQYQYPASFLHKKTLREIKHIGITKNVLSCCNFERETNHESKKISSFIDSMTINANDMIVVYSYWLSAIGMVAINIKNALKKRGTTAALYSRAHGFDLYRERAYQNYQPFQKYMVENIDRIYPCSEQGSAYLKNLYPESASKIKRSYLGVADKFDGRYSGKNGIFHIVSCSNLIPLKRVDLIAQALSIITDIQIKWTHFGDGELMERLKAEIAKLPKNITVELPGRVPNSDIYQYYNNHNVNLFINVSTSEGLPVSIMEAISFGIPVIATDVGGTSEIVIDGVNGRLLPEHFETDTLTDMIRESASLSDADYNELSRNARKLYEDRFNADKNYTEFCKELLS